MCGVPGQLRFKKHVGRGRHSPWSNVAQQRQGGGEPGGGLGGGGGWREGELLLQAADKGQKERASEEVASLFQEQRP